MEVEKGLMGWFSVVMVERKGGGKSEGAATLRSRSERRKTTTRRLDLRSVSSSLVHFSLSQSEER